MGNNETIDLAQKILAWVSVNEPVDNFQELIEQSKLEENKLKLNIERLHSAGIIEGQLIKTLGQREFVHANNVRLSYGGTLELQRLIDSKKLLKDVEINLGAIKFKL